MRAELGEEAHAEREDLVLRSVVHEVEIAPEIVLEIQNVDALEDLWRMLVVGSMADSKL